MRVLDLVRCFLIVADSGGFTQASKQLFLTQSAVTLKIKRLEDYSNGVFSCGRLSRCNSARKAM
jgi:hypothetical protein